MSQTTNTTASIDLAQLNKLLNVGAQMSNVMYNLSQGEGQRLTHRTTQTMGDLQKRWDDARRSLTSGAPAAALSERDMLDIATSAGLWPNTIHHWMPALQRYTTAVLAARAHDAAAPSAEQARTLAKVISYLVANDHMRWKGFDDDELFSDDNAEFQAILALVERAIPHIEVSAGAAAKTDHAPCKECDGRGGKQVGSGLLGPGWEECSSCDGSGQASAAGVGSDQAPEWAVYREIWHGGASEWQHTTAKHAAFLLHNAEHYGGTGSKTYEVRWLALLPGSVSVTKGVRTDTTKDRAAPSVTVQDERAPKIDVKHEFEKWASNRGESAVYIGDGLYRSSSVTDQAEAFAAGVELGRAAHPVQDGEKDAQRWEYRGFYITAYSVSGKTGAALTGTYNNTRLPDRTYFDTKEQCMGYIDCYLDDGAAMAAAQKGGV